MCVVCVVLCFLCCAVLCCAVLLYETLLVCKMDNFLSVSTIGQYKVDESDDDRANALVLLLLHTDPNRYHN